MPLSKYYGGKGESVMKKMKSEYGAEKGERVFYATANKMKNTKERCCMGRQMIHHSPPKHPEQDDPYAQMDKDLEKATQSKPSNYQQQREQMKPMQQESPKPAQGLMKHLEYLRKLGGGK
jgi:hypothetical protein